MPHKKKAPPYSKTILDNGLRLITIPMPHTRSVSIGFFVGAGSRYETDEQAGISHYIEHMCFKGTKKRPSSRELCAEIEGVGGVFNGSTDKELTIYWCKVAQLHYRQAFDVMADMVTNPAFDPLETEKERQVIIEEINMGKDSPSQEAAILIDGLLWPGQALGRDIAGTKPSVAALSREMMLSYMAKHYNPANTVLSIAGAVRTGDILPLVEKTLGAWPGQSDRITYAPYREKLATRVRVEKRETEQVQLCLAMPGIGLTHPRRFSLDLLNVILGEGMSSRLFAEIRDKLGLAYSIYSYAEHFLDTGSVIVAAGVESKNVEKAVRAILEELAKLKQFDSVTELARAKELSKGRLLLSMEDSRNVAAWVGGQEILTGKAYSIDEIVAIVDAITIEDIRQVAGELLVGNKLRLAVVGPIKNEERLEGLLEL
ncbi:MAG: pitrilysin family protein [Dehalococcoidales bacterium]|nr:pitrilysin family protein [Dehalococcoidales bacterium]